MWMLRILLSKSLWWLYLKNHTKVKFLFLCKNGGNCLVKRWFFDRDVTCAPIKCGLYEILKLKYMLLNYPKQSLLDWFKFLTSYWKYNVIKLLEFFNGYLKNESQMFLFIWLSNVIHCSNCENIYVHAT